MKKISYRNINTLFSRFILLFIIIAIFFIVTLIINVSYQSRKQKMYNLKEKTIKIQTDFYNDNIQINNFFIYSLVDPLFYEENKSVYLNKHDSILKNIKINIDFITSQKDFQKIDTINTKVIFENLLSSYQIILDSIVDLSIKRGFKDYGYVGQMRDYAHTLEGFSYFDKAKTLMLRRHEKDYIIRGEKKYINLFIEKNKKYQSEVISSFLSKNQKDTIIETLKNYLKNYKTVVAYDSLLGIKYNIGLARKFTEIQQSLQEKIDIMIELTQNHINKTEKRLKIVYIFVSLFLIIISFVGGLIITRYITRPISKLSDNIKVFFESNFKKTHNFKYKTSIAEIVILIEYYFSMKKNILSLLNKFQQKVKERTEEVQSQKELIEKQKIKVEKTNNDMIASFQYAKKIQEAILPSEKELKNDFKDFFVIYKPKDIVSGDFLWYRKVKNERFNMKLIAVADCTGHGVPGALMSMLSIAYLNEIILRKEVVHANKVLEILRLNIISNFKHDGLDIAFIIIDKDNKKIEFAGANRHLFIKRKDKVIKIKGNRMPIGKYPTTNFFENKTFSYKKGDIILAFSDGITDQLSENGSKLTSKNFLSVFENNKLLKDIKFKMLHEFNNWKKNNEQTDDVLVFCAVL